MAFDLSFFKIHGSDDLAFVDTLSRATWLDDNGREDPFFEPAYITLRGVDSTAPKPTTASAAITRSADRGGTPQPENPEPASGASPRKSTRTIRLPATDTPLRPPSPARPASVTDSRAAIAELAASEPDQETSSEADTESFVSKTLGVSAVEQWTPEFDNANLVWPAHSTKLESKWRDGIAFVPSVGLRGEIVALVHHLCGHRVGRAALAKLVYLGFWWPKAAADLSSERGRCVTCLRRDVLEHGFHPAREGVNEIALMDEVHLDFAALPLDEDGFSVLLIAREALSGFFWLRALKAKTHDGVAAMIMEQISPMGLPRVFISDNEIVSDAVATAVANVNATQRLITPWNPAANGKAEAGVKSAKALILKTIEDYDVRSWSRHLWKVASVLNDTVLERTMATPFVLMFKRWPRPTYSRSATGDLEPLSPGDFEAFEARCRDQARFSESVLEPSLASRMREYDLRSRAKLDKGRKIVTFNKGDLVFVDDPLAPKTAAKRNGPFEIACKSFHGNYLLYDPPTEGRGREIMCDEQQRFRRFSAHHLIKAGDGFESRAGERFWYIHEILADRVLPSGERAFLIRWKDWDGDADWVPASAFNGREAIDAYDHQQRLITQGKHGKAGRPRRGPGRPRKNVPDL
jgi:hypothetical protein